MGLLTPKSCRERPICSWPAPEPIPPPDTRQCQGTLTATDPFEVSEQEPQDRLS